jgi:hypothetical protein
LAFGGDGYDTIGRSLVYYGGDADALADYLATKPSIRTEPEGRVTHKPRFDDVSKDAWYFDTIVSAAARGLIESGHLFNPHTPVTANEMQELLGGLLPNGESSITGDAPLTRERLAVMLSEFLMGYELAEASGEPSYADAGLIGGEYLEAVAFAYKTRLMLGDGKSFNPQGIVTRAQAAAVLINIVKEEFK